MVVTDESADCAMESLSTRMPSMVVAIVCAAAMLFVTVSGALAAEKSPRQVRFDHIKTGFNLTGAHLRAR